MNKIIKFIKQNVKFVKTNMKFVRSNWKIALILSVGLFLRVYKPIAFFSYGHDQDLAGWMIKDILVNHHIRLIGQETSSGGVFIGPLFYYLQIPFFWLTRMEPTGPILLVTLLGTFSVFSIYYVFKKVWNKNVGLISSLLYATSVFIIFTDRETVPTMPAMLWTIWFFYSIWNLLKGNQKYYILLSILLGLAWHFNLALVLLTPLILVVQLLSKKKIDLKYLFIGIASAIILMSPFFVFEARHGYIQTKAIYSSFTTQKDFIPGTSKGFGKWDRTFQLVKANTNHILWSFSGPIPGNFTFYLLADSFLFLVYKKILSREISLIFFLWGLLFVAFFSLNSLNISEYYINGMNVIWIAITALVLDHFSKSKNLKIIVYAILILSVFFNLRDYTRRESNRIGYLQKKGMVTEIKEDSIKHGYPCVSVSYITSPGNELGYRYLFWLAKLHVNQPKSFSPVYTIVFPLSKVDSIDKTFGALGLIYPEYKKYNQKDVDESCSGMDSNVTDPMFGYTE